MNIAVPEQRRHLLDVQSLTKMYGGFPALNELTLQLDGGQIVGLLGENGCGKTTLLKVLAGVLNTYNGQVLIDGHSPGPETKALVSFLPDTSFLTNRATVDACLELYGDFFADFNKEHARDLIQFFGLDQNKRLGQMSKGMREKVQIALTMGRDARVYLLDEPISGVDPAARNVILEGIVRHITEDKLVLIATHLIHDLEPVLDSVVMMRHGQILLAGEVDDLRAQHNKTINDLFREVYR